MIKYKVEIKMTARKIFEDVIYKSWGFVIFRHKDQGNGNHIHLHCFCPAHRLNIASTKVIIRHFSLRNKLEIQTED